MPTRRLMAKDAAFYRGSYIERGAVFEFHGDTAPKWAVEVGSKLAPLKQSGGDTKPAAAAKAAKLKASGAADQVA